MFSSVIVLTRVKSAPTFQFLIVLLFVIGKLLLLATFIIALKFLAGKYSTCFCPDVSWIRECGQTSIKQAIDGNQSCTFPMTET